MKKIVELFRRIAQSRGMHPVRILLTALYAVVLVVCAPIFTSSIGNYPVQALSLAGFIGSALLLWRSLKRMFDRKTRDTVSKFLHKVMGKISGAFERLGLRIIKALGIDKIRAYGKDERDFVFRERRGRRRGAQKLRNPLYWQDMEDNAEKVRYIFTDYMIRALKDGYRMKPSKTPEDMRRDLAHGDTEKLLFSAYSAARYSGGREPIENNVVDELSELCEKKRRKQS